MDTDKHSASEIKRVLQFKNIAVVGMSKNEEKPAHFVPKYLMDHGYNVIPVNPNVNEILGRKSYPAVSEIPEDVDVVDVFRRSNDVRSVIDDVIRKKGIKVIWMQSGIYNKEAEKKAKENGIDVIFNRCIMVEHRQYLQ